MAKNGQKTPKIKGFLTLFWGFYRIRTLFAIFGQFRASPALG
jgi:hypothetical protein